MTVKISFDKEIEVVVQYHLDSGLSVQEYVRAAVKFFNHCREIEKTNNVIGYGNRLNIERYHTLLNTNVYLNNQD